MQHGRHLPTTMFRPIGALHTKKLGKQQRNMTMFRDCSFGQVLITWASRYLIHGRHVAHILVL
ncbi:hypothetical protein D3C85_908710 [compost metagenome]